MDGMRFCSPSVKWQEHLCERFSVDHKLTPNLYSNERKFLGPPVSIHRITGDGNCLFRSFAYVISGNEDNHDIFRTLIVSHLSETGGWVLSDETTAQYLQRTQMFEDKVWGTEVEIYTASALFGCRVYVYSKYGDVYKWLEFKPLIRSSIPLQDESIYLYHRDGCHYDVVNSVRDHESEGSVIENYKHESSFEQVYRIFPLVKNVYYFKKL